MNAISSKWFALTVAITISCGPSMGDDDDGPPINCPLGAQVIPAIVTVSDDQGVLVDCALIEWSFVPQEGEDRSSLRCGSCADETMSEPSTCESIPLNGLQGVEMLELSVSAEGYKDHEEDVDVVIADDGCSVLAQEIRITMDDE